MTRLLLVFFACGMCLHACTGPIETPSIQSTPPDILIAIQPSDVGLLVQPKNPDPLNTGIRAIAKSYVKHEGTPG